MELLRTIGLMLLALSILIVIHEAGHFWAARMFKIKVEKFFLFFDYKFKLFSVKKGETEYGIGWIPLGGYVKIAGMLDESMDETQVQGPPQPWEFRAKPIWQRLIVMLGGIFMNVVLGCVIFIGLKFFVGDSVIPMDRLTNGIYVPETSLMYKQGFRTGDQILNYRGDVYPNLDDYSNPAKLVDEGKYFEVKHADGKTEKITLGDGFLDEFQNAAEGGGLFSPDFGPSLFPSSPEDSAKDAKAAPGSKPTPTAAYRAGMRKGDVLVSIDGVKMNRFLDLRKYLKEHAAQTVKIDVTREGKPMSFVVTPRVEYSWFDETYKGQFDSLVSGPISYFGIGPNVEVLKDTVTYSFFESIPKGVSAAFAEVTNNVKGLKALATGKVNASKSMSGPIGIARIYGSGFDAGGWTFFWKLTGMLSMVLAVMNLLPIPVLDGGHVLILSIEGIIGREIPIKIKEVVMYIGFFMVLALMAFVIGNDILKLF